MIEKARFKNFKSLRDVELEGLTDFAVFVGPNASGKTSILEGLFYLSRSLLELPYEVFYGPADPRVILTRDAESERVCLEVEGDWLQQKSFGKLDIDVSEIARLDLDVARLNVLDGWDRFFELDANFVESLS